MDEEYENSMVHQINSKVKGEQSTEDLEKYYNKEEKEKKQNDAKLGLSVSNTIEIDLFYQFHYIKKSLAFYL